MTLLKQKQQSALRQVRRDLEDLKANCEQLLSEMDQGDGFLHSENLLTQNAVLAEFAHRYWHEVTVLEWVKGRGDDY